MGFILKVVWATWITTWTTRATICLFGTCGTDRAWNSTIRTVQHHESGRNIRYRASLSVLYGGPRPLEQSAQDGTAGEFDEDDETNKAGLELSKDLIGTVPDLPERPSTPPQRKRTHTLVSRTPTKPATPPQPPPPRASNPIEEDPYELPASTAPARLAPGGRPRRERVQTERAKAARRAGWLPEEQARE